MMEGSLGRIWQRGPLEPLAGSPLPLFRSLPAPHDAPETWYYAPGYLAIVEGRVAPFETDLLAPGDGSGHAAELRRHARAAQATWADALTRPFAPVCLTVYLDNRCNLACPYCYSSPLPRTRTTPRITLTALRAAAELVARNCVTRSRPFVLVLHGGGEPTLDRPFADEVIEAVVEVVSQHQLALFRYVATNGVMPRAAAAWLAERFEVIGLSCDGPPGIHDRQRPTLGGAGSLRSVQRTARVVRQAGKPLHVRVTITPDSLAHQPEIARFICEELEPQEINVEPEYRVGRAPPRDRPGFAAAAAEEFVTGFLEARVVSRGFGVEWRTSGARVGDVHGPYCHVFRDVLHIVPGDVATACFATVDSDRARQRGLDLGAPDVPTGGCAMSQPRLRLLRRSLRREPSRCDRCFNRYHCTRDCPDTCALDSPPVLPSFRCRVQALLAYAQLREAARALHAGGGCADGVLGGPVA